MPVHDRALEAIEKWLLFGSGVVGASGMIAYAKHSEVATQKRKLSILVGLSRARQCDLPH